MIRQTRRTFLKNTLAAAATITIAGTKSSGRVLGANDTVRVAVAGLHGRGGAHVGEFAGIEQHCAALQAAGFGADRENTQRLLAQHREGGHALEKGNIVIQSHGLWHQLVAAGFRHQDGRRGGVLRGDATPGHDALSCEHNGPHNFHGRPIVIWDGGIAGELRPGMEGHPGGSHDGVAI